MAYRELFCNARDERGDAYLTREMLNPQAYKTFVVVEGNEFEAVHANRWAYFIEDAPDYEIDGLQVFNRPSSHYFYRGVRVASLPILSYLTFNDSNVMELTQHRISKDAYWIPLRIARALLTAKDEPLLYRVSKSPPGRLEYALDFHCWAHNHPMNFSGSWYSLRTTAFTSSTSPLAKSGRKSSPRNSDPRFST